MAAVRNTLEHFYISLATSRGDAKGSLKVAARTAQVTQELIARLTDRYPLSAAEMPQSLTLLRDGVGGQFFAVHVMRNTDGKPLGHYIVLPSDTLRAMQGNLRALVGILDTTSPNVASRMPELLPIALTNLVPITPDQQTEDMLTLLSIAGNRMDSVEQMMAAIIQGVRLVVQNAPADVAQRLKLVDGLLAMLPPSVRFAVTFTTDSATHEDVDCQVCFAREPVSSPDVVRFDWASGQTFGVPLRDDYARFVMSQLRLDTSLVIERTTAMTPAAGWYLSQGHRLVDALAYGSYRLKVDEALLSGQPVSHEDASTILRTDPTLSDSLRAAYARHLLQLALVMHAVTDADPVADLFVKFPELERDALIQLASACHKGEAPDVYRLVTRWLAKDVELPSRLRWQQLAQRAALMGSRALAEAHDLSGLSSLIPDLIATARIANLREVSRPLLETLVPFASKGSDLANDLFLMVADLMDADNARQFLSAPSIQGLLPQDVATFLNVLKPDSGHAPPGVLLKAARAFGSHLDARLIAQFALWARQYDRLDLLETDVLSALTQAALEADDHTRADIGQVADGFTPDQLEVLGQQGSFQLLRIKLAIGDYAALGTQLRMQSKTLYVGEKQLLYLRVVERLFTDTPIPAEEIPNAIAALNEQGIVGAPLAMAGLGSLVERTPSPPVDVVATDVITIIRATPDIVSVLPTLSLARLVAYMLMTNNAASAAETTLNFGAAAEKQKVSFVDAARQLVAACTKPALEKADGMAILRTFVRSAPAREHPQILAYLSREFGLDRGAQFEITRYIYHLMSGKDLATFLRSAAITWRLLGALNVMFIDRNEIEAEHVESMLSGLAGVLGQADRTEIRAAVLDLIKALAAATELKRATRPREDRLTTSFDILRAMGVALSSAAFNNPSLPPGQPFGVPDKQALKQAVITSLAFVVRLTRPSPPNVTARAVKAEIDSMVLVQDDEARQMINERASMLVQLSRLIPEIGAESNSGLLEANNHTKKLDVGRENPTSELEVLRCIFGYFGRQA
jgi:hypothetical protein